MPTLPNPTTYRFQTETVERLADLVTPVTAYLRVRDLFPGSHLLESADSRAAELSVSYLCVNPIASYRVEDGHIEVAYPDGSTSRTQIRHKREVIEGLKAFRDRFSADDPIRLFGFLTFSAIQYFEDIEFRTKPGPGVPDLVFEVFEYVVRFDSFVNRLSVVKLEPEGFTVPRARSSISDITTTLLRGEVVTYPFSTAGEETSTMTDGEFLDVIDLCKTHIQRGDVFQIVPSRRFSRPYRGDPFAVYRALRSLNPSPYLFYFDHGGFQLFGSSPESQILIEGRSAGISPIAGTYRRGKDPGEDLELAQRLQDDPKESSEHVMLVDLARNDLSVHCERVHVEAFKEVHFYSHVLHLVSRVKGELTAGVDPLDVIANTFPAGTLSGTPKYRALQLIDSFEPESRACYGGAIGFLDTDGDCNLAIVIRAFLAQSGSLHYQAGCGVVSESQPQTELDEVKAKLAALRQSIESAEGFHENPRG